MHRWRAGKTKQRTFTQGGGVLPQHRRHVTRDGGQALEGALTQAVRLPLLHGAQQRGQQLRPRVVANHASRLAQGVAHLATWCVQCIHS